MIPAFPSKGRPRWAWPANTRARWARWATARWRSPAATLIRRPRGRWPCACTGPGRGPRIRNAAGRPVFRRRCPFRPSPTSPCGGSIRRGRGACRTAAWWPMPTMATTPISWRAWRPGANPRWEGCGQTFGCVTGAPPSAPCSGPMSGGTLCPEPSGARATGDPGPKAGWLLGERMTRGPPEERQYSWSNLPASATLEELAGYAHRRYAVEPCHEEAKGELGWDQDQGRLWPGFHRHTVTVMLAYRFLVWLELRQRRARRGRGRPRDPFSPSAGSPEACTTRCASRSCSVATPPGCAVVDHHQSIHRSLLT